MVGDCIQIMQCSHTFIRVMNDIFKPFLDDFVLEYLDDIPFFSRAWEDHVSHVKMVLDVFQKKYCMSKFLSVNLVRPLWFTWITLSEVDN